MKDTAQDLARQLRSQWVAGMLRRVRVPALVAVGVAAICGALAGAGLGAPAQDPLAALTPTAGLVLPVVLTVALLAIWSRELAAAAEDAEIPRSLQARGADAGQVLRLLAGGLAGPVLRLVAVGLAVALAAVALTDAWGQAAPNAGFWLACGWTLLAVALVVATAVGARWSGWRAVPTHFRQAAVPTHDRLRRLWLDAGLVALAGLLAWWAAAQIASGAAAPSVVSLLDWGAVAFLGGGALLAERALAAYGPRLARRAGAASATWMYGAATWAAQRRRFLLLPAVVVGAGAFLVFGTLATAAGDRSGQAVAAGADLRVAVTWPRPCNPCAFTRDLPVPDPANILQYLPGVNAGSVMIQSGDEVSALAGLIPVEVYGVAPSSFGQVVDLGAIPNGPADLAAIQGGGAVVSTALADQLGLQVGDTVSGQLLHSTHVAAIAPAWPGLGGGGGDWMVVDSGRLSRALTISGQYGAQGLAGAALLEVPPDTPLAPILSQLAANGVTVGAVASRTAGLAGFGPDLILILPLLAAIAWVAWDAWPPVPDADRDLMVALGADPEAEGVRRLTHRLRLWVGGAWGLALGALAVCLFWPLVRVLPGGAVTALSLPRPWWTLGFAVAAGLGGWWVLWRDPALRPEAPDPVIAARLAERVPHRAAILAPEPAPTPAMPLPVASPAPRAPKQRRVQVRPAPQARQPRAAGAHFAFFAMVGLAVRRLRASSFRVVGLAAGILLAAAVAATVPIYTVGSLTRVLHSGLQPLNDRPAGAVLFSFFPADGVAYNPQELQRLQALAASAGKRVGLAATPVVSYLETSPETTVQASQRSQPTAQVQYLALDGISDMAPHVTIERGHLPAAQETGGVIQVIATDQTMISNNLHLGDTYAMSTLGSSALNVKIVGVFAEKNPQGNYWPYRYFGQDLFANSALVQRIAVQQRQLALQDAAWYTVLDLNQLSAQGVPAAMARMQGLAQAAGNVATGARLDVSPFASLQGFAGREQTLAALLRLVSIPVLAMALYFVAITASLIMGAEASEISVYSSRGANARHILLLYLIEWVTLAIPLAIVAPLPALAFARVMGAASGFLHFSARAPLPVHLAGADFVYAGLAAALAVAAALLPTVATLSRSIVESRLRSSRTVEQPLWQRAYLDGAALVLLLVLWLVFRHVTLEAGGVAAIVSDPALYLLPPAFLVVAGLFAVRFVGWLLRTADRGFGVRLSPSSVLPLRRIGRLPAQFAPVLLLLCFTAALGMYSAAAARTLDNNLTAAVRYQLGAPVRLQQVSPCTSMQSLVGVCKQYDNVDPTLASGAARPMPPFSLTRKVAGVAQATDIEVMPITVAAGGNDVAATLLMIDPASYAQVAFWQPGWNPRPESAYMRLLQDNQDAALVSPGLAATGGEITVATSSGNGGGGPGGAGGLGGGGGGVGTSGAFAVAGRLRGLPGADISGPFVVTTQATGQRVLNLTCGTSPCVALRDVLLRPSAGTQLSALEQGMEKYGLFTGGAQVTAAQEAAALATPEWAGQSGVLTIGFLVALAVTAAGYLLYAGLLLRGQLNQLGLLRALGLDWSGVVGTVAFEQGILVVFGALTGVIAGLVAARLFLPLFQPAFTGPDAPPFVTASPGAALWQVSGVLLVLFALVIGGLLALLKRMHVGETVRIEEA